MAEGRTMSYPSSSSTISTDSADVNKHFRSFLTNLKAFAEAVRDHVGKDERFRVEDQRLRESGADLEALAEYYLYGGNKGEGVNLFDGYKNTQDPMKRVNPFRKKRSLFSPFSADADEATKGWDGSLESLRDGGFREGPILAQAEEISKEEEYMIKQRQPGGVMHGLLLEDGHAPPPPVETMQAEAMKLQLQKEKEAAEKAELGEKVEKDCDYHGIQIQDECPAIASGFDWAMYSEQLYHARSLIFSHEIENAKAQTFGLLNHITKKFSFAFECPLATVSTYFTLATILMFQGSLRRAQIYLLMGFIFVRDKGFHECTPWPIQGWDMMMAGKNLAEKIRELDKPSINFNVPKQFRYLNQKMAIVTICSYAPEEVVRQVSIENHRIYADLHGYDLYMYLSPDEIAPNEKAGMNVKDGVHKPFFWKVNAVKNVFDQTNGKAPHWVLWADCDALFMDPERTIDSIIETYTSNYTAPLVRNKPNFDQTTFEVIDEYLNSPNREKNQKVHGDVSLLLTVDSTGINNGVWMLRNSPWGNDFLVKWWHSKILEGPGENHNCSDQSTMQHELLYQNSMNLDPAWDMVEGPIWPQEVRVTYQEHMQSFHQATAITVLSREWQDGDFIRHHPGCHYYKEPCKWLYQQGREIFMAKAVELTRRIEQEQQRAKQQQQQQQQYR